MTTKTYDKDPLGILEGSSAKADPLGILEPVKKKESGIVSKSPSPSIGTGEGGLVPLEKNNEPFPLTYKRDKEQMVADIRTPEQRTKAKGQAPLAAGFVQVQSPKKDETFKVELTDNEAEQKAIDSFRSGEHSVEPNSQDPVGELASQINIKKYSYPDYKVARKKIEILNDNFFRTGEEAEKYLEHNQDKPETNVTKQLATKRYKEYDNVKTALQGSNSLEEAAINYAVNSGNEQVKALLEHSGGTIGGITDQSSAIPQAVKGQLLLSFMMNKDLRQMAEKNPDLNRSLKEDMYNFPNHYPEEATKLLAEAIADRRDKNGLNNSFANIVSKTSTDKIVKELIDDGTIPSNYQFLYEKTIRPKLGTAQSIGRGIGNAIPGLNQLVNEGPIPTPGMLENFESGFENAQVSTAKGLVNMQSLLGMPTLTDALQPKGQQLFNILKDQAETPQFEPTSLRQKAAMHGANMAAFVTMLGGGTSVLKAVNLIKNPALASATMMGLSTLGDTRDKAISLFPRNDFKQTLYIDAMTGLNAAIGKYLPGQNIGRLLSKGEGTVADVLSKMVDGKISTSAAKNQIMEWFGDTAKSTLKGGEFMGAISAADDLLTQTLQGKKLNLEQTLEAGWEGAKLGLISTPILGGFEAALKSNKGFRTEILDMAENSEYYKKLAETESEKNPEFNKIKDDVIKNLTYIGDAYKEFEGADMSTKDKQKSLLNSLAHKIKLDKAELATDPTVKKQYQQEAKDLGERVEASLNGIPEKKVIENQAFDKVKKLYDNEYIPDGDLMMLETESETGKKTFDEKKVKEYLKFIAQQSNNVTEDGKFNEGSDVRKSFIRPKSLVEAANELFPEYKKIANEADAAKESSSTPMEATTEGAAENVVPSTLKEKANEIAVFMYPDEGDKGYVKDGREKVLDNPRKELDRLINFYETETIPREEKENSSLLGFAKDNLDKLKKLRDEYNALESKQQTKPIEQVNETQEAPKFSEQTETTSEPTEGTNTPIPPTEEGKGAVAEGGEKKTGIKNAVSESTRAVLELPKIEVPKLGKDAQIIGEGKELVDSGSIEPQAVVERINSTNNHYMSRDEAKAMQYYMHQLGQHETQIREQLAQTEDPTTKANYVGLLGQLSDLQDAATEANIKAGKDWSDVGNIRQILVDQSFNPSREKAIIKDAYGGEIPKDAKLKIDAALKQRDEAIAERAKLEEQLREKEAALKAAQMQKEGKKTKAKGDFKDRINSLKDELKAAKDEHEQWLKDNGIQKSGVGFTLTGKMAKVIGKIAAEYAKEGFKTVEELINKVYDEVKGHLTGIEKKHIRDAIAMWEAEKLTGKAERLEDKITPPSVDPKTGKPFEPKEPASKLKIKFKTNSAWVAATQRIANAEYKIKVQKRLAFESEKNMFQKGLMWAGRLTRLSVLSGYNVLYKLAAAATIGGAAKRIPEQLIGRVYQTVFKGIAERAPIEGYINAKSEAKFYKEFFNPKKFVKNSWQILKTGESDLNKRFGAGGYEHVPLLYLPTDLHQVIKDPVKRATYEASLKNSMIWAEKNGLDINDPLVLNTLETAAYKRGNYEIFQESNWLSKQFGAFKAKMDKAGNTGAVGKFIADFMIPVSTVPTNIVRRLVTSSPLGLIRGSKMVVEAYRKGIENLEPEAADAVMKQLKQGSLGTALWLVGWFGASAFGGLYSKYNPNKERDEGELASDEMEVDGKMIPKPVQHALPFEIIQWAATARHIYDNYKENKGASTFQSIYEAGMGSIGAVAEHIPIIETASHVVGAFKNPYEAEKLKEDVTRRFQPQILRETGIIPKAEKPATGTSKKQTKSQRKDQRKQTKQ